MLRVTIDLLPFGSERNKKNLKTFDIINNGQNMNRPDYGDYIVREHGTKKTFKIVDHLRKTGYMPLLNRAIVVIREYEFTKRLEDLLTYVDD